MMGLGITVLLVSHATDNIRIMYSCYLTLSSKLVIDSDVDYVYDAYIEASKASEEQLSDLKLQ